MPQCGQRSRHPTSPRPLRVWSHSRSILPDQSTLRASLSRAEYLVRLEQANIANSLDNLMTFPRLRKLIERGSVATHGAYFGVATGELWIREEASGEFAPAASDALPRAR